MKHKKIRPHLLTNNTIDEKITVVGLSYKFLHDCYHAALTISWRRFIVFYILIFLFTNVVFAFFYAIFPHAINNSTNRILDAFFLSIQTMSTVGYGSISPNGNFSNFISSVEITFSMILNAVSTGLIFARFAKPISKIIFAEHAVISSHNGVSSLDIRVANGRKTVMLNVSVEVSLCSFHKDEQGRVCTKVENLPLTQDRIPVLKVLFEANHIINETSPLYHKTKEGLKKTNTVISVNITGIDEATGQSMYCYNIYDPEQVAMYSSFKELDCNQNDNRIFVNMTNFNEIQPDRSHQPIEPSVNTTIDTSTNK